MLRPDLRLAAGQQRRFGATVMLAQRDVRWAVIRWLVGVWVLSHQGSVRGARVRRGSGLFVGLGVLGKLVVELTGEPVRDLGALS